jgi:MFS family permease
MAQNRKSGNSIGVAAPCSTLSSTSSASSRKTTSFGFSPLIRYWNALNSAMGSLSSSYLLVQPNRTTEQEDAAGIPVPSMITPQDDHWVTREDENDSIESTATYSTCFLVQLTVTTSIGGLLFGYDLGIIAPALPVMTQHFGLTDEDSHIQGLIVSILYFGCILGALTSGICCDVYGRKRTILLADVAFGLGSVIMWLAPTIPYVLCGRIALGYGIATSGIANVTYLHELAPTSHRGAMVSVNEACIAAGFLLAFCSGILCTALDPSSNSWRIMFAISGVIALIQVGGMIRLPESPVWLRLKQQQRQLETGGEGISTDLAQSNPPVATVDNTAEDDGHFASSSPEEQPQRRRRVVAVQNYEQQPSSSLPPTHAPPMPLNAMSLAGTANVHQDEQYCQYESISLAPQLTQAASFQQGEARFMFANSYRNSSWRHLVQACSSLASAAHSVIASLSSFQNRHRPAMVVAVFLAAMQQFCGQSVVLSYALTILQQRSPSPGDGSHSSSGNSDQGWDATLSIGLVKFVVTVLVIWKIEATGRRFLLLSGMLTIVFGLVLLSVSFVGYDADVATANTSLPGVLFVVSGYSMSFGPLSWLLTSEIFPADIRGRALGMSTIVTYSCAAAVTYTFLSFKEWLGASAVFALYSLFTSIGIIFAYFAIPETGHKTQVAIARDMLLMPFWKRMQQLPALRDDEYSPPVDAQHTLSSPGSGVQLT